MKKILIVDDNPDNVDVIKYKLQRSKQFKLEVTESYSGEDAIDIVSKEDFDIVLLDVMMPRISGFEVCRRIKKYMGDEFLPIILVTAREDIDSKLKGFEAGADDYLAKPFDLQELEARIKSMLRIKDLQDELREMNSELQRTSEKLLKVERLAAVGAVVATVNHEINNPLCAIMLNAQLIKTDLVNHPDKILERSSNIEHNVERIQKITNQIQDLKDTDTTEYVSGDVMLDLSKD
jgi:DNA-binding response OmpR family regulator